MAQRRGDRPASPTRHDWEAAADRLLAGVRPFASRGRALIDLPGPVSVSGRWSDGLEGFARTFLLAGFRLAHHSDDRLASFYADGLASGTDPSSSERWPRLGEIRQARVEAASVAIALHESRAQIWDRLPAGVRERVVDWLAGMVGLPMASNNWIWFQGVVTAFLRSVGGPWRQRDLDRIVELTDRWYAGGGWYTDGDGPPGERRTFDHYNGWAMHLYPLWSTRIAGADADPELVGRYGDRLRRFLADAQHLVGGDGAPLFHGRSLTYRFAMLAPFWAGALFEVSPLPPGRTRLLAGRVLGHFLGHGAVDGDTGLLSLGWHHRFEAIRQGYSGPASPYWASKGFAGLAIPPEHPVWTAPEEPAELDDADVELTLAEPGWVVSATRADGVVRVAMHGGSKDSTADAGGPAISTGAREDLYGRVGYSTHAAPHLDGAPAEDSTVALVDATGAVSWRRPVLPVYVSGRVGVSRHRAWWISEAGTAVVGPWMTLASVVRGPHEVRLAFVHDDVPIDMPRDLPGDMDVPPRSARLRFSGYPLAAGSPPPGEVSSGRAEVRLADGLTSSVRSLPVAGATSAPPTDAPASTVPEVMRFEGLNALGHHSATPMLGTTAEVRPGVVHAALVSLGRNLTPGDATTVTSTTVAGGCRMSVTWPDGRRDDVRLA